MENKKALVTGHLGYIGSHIFKELNTRGYEPRGIDLKNGEDILHCLPNEDFDCVFHLAALPRVEFSVENPFYTMKQNVLVTSKLLEWSKNHGVKTFIFSSSSALYGEGSGPKSPYGLHKLISEMECELYQKLYDIRCVCLRYFNVYSEDQEYGGAYSTVVAAWMQMIKEEKSLRIDGDGEQSRDFIHVEDVVSANIYCMENINNLKELWYDVGYGKTCSLNQIREIVNKYHKVEWDNAPERQGDVKHTEIGSQRLQLEGWSPHVSLSGGLEKCFKI
jgi:nucleoside-diphosphate-sugar epimerase